MTGILWYSKTANSLELCQIKFKVLCWIALVRSVGDKDLGLLLCQVGHGENCLPGGEGKHLANSARVELYDVGQIYKVKRFENFNYFDRKNGYLMLCVW
jgi:hypothetical protein